MNTVSRTTSWLAICVGSAIFLGSVSYEWSFHVFNRIPLLTFSAFLIVIGALLNPTLVWTLHQNLHAQSLESREFIVITGLIGSLIVLIGSGLDFLNTIAGHNLIILYSLSQTQSIIAVGYAFIGIWLLLLNVQARLHAVWPRRLVWLGIISGVIMAIALLAIPRVFIPYVSLYHKLVPELGELVGNLGWRLFYPIWSIWFGSLYFRGLSRDKYLQSSIP